MTEEDLDEVECRCPNGNRSRGHLEWHLLVIAQGGPAGLVNAKTLQSARGMRTPAPDQHVIAERNRRAGKTASRETRARLR